MLLLVDVNFSEMGLVLLGYMYLGKSQWFLDELELYKKKKERKDYVWWKNKKFVKNWAPHVSVDQLLLLHCGMQEMKPNALKH